MKTGKLILSFLLCASFVCADTITVTSLDDSGSGTLREAMTNAVSGDTINFDPMLTGTITLQSSLPSIAVDYLIFQGPLDNSITIDGDSAYRIFDVQTGPMVISHLNLNNGADANQGGAIFVGNAVYLIASNLNITPASGTDGENPIFVDGDGYFDVTDTLFTSASANQIYLNASSMSATCNIPMAFNIDGVGGGVVVKYGSDTLDVTAPTGITSGYYLMVNEGTLAFSGAVDGPGVVFSGGEIDGSCAFYDLINFGAVMPGNSSTIGTMSLTADYNSLIAVDKVKIEPNGNCDLIETASGDIYLYDSVLTILPESGTYTQGTKFTFLTTNGGVNGTYDSVSVEGLDVQINYNNQSVEVEILTTTTI